jgi:hypothetical protein
VQFGKKIKFPSGRTIQFGKKYTLIWQNGAFGKILISIWQNSAVW